MSGTFKAWWATDVDGKVNVELCDVADADLPANEVTVAVKYSTVNYKDGMAVQGNKSKIMRSLPMAPGIDYAGVVEASDSPDYSIGDEVVLTGWGVGETVSGGLSQRARAKADWLVKKPDGLTLQQCMAIGTAGFTAMMSVLALEDAGVKPGDGDVIVTGRRAASALSPSPCWPIWVTALPPPRAGRANMTICGDWALHPLCRDRN